MRDDEERGNAREWRGNGKALAGAWRARAFAPAAHVLDRILERWPLAA